MDRISIFVTRDTNQEVVWLDIAIDQGFVVDRLHASNLHEGNNRSASVGPGVSHDDWRQRHSDGLEPTGDPGAKEQAYLGQEKNANHLPCGHTNSLDTKLAVAEVEEVFQVGTQEIDDENIMETLLSEMVDLRNAGYAASRGVRMKIAPDVQKE